MAYFLLSVSNRVNLELCIEYALAGFTNSVNGLWAFVDIEEGDFVSFLYGARVFNLYRVEKKEALKGADAIGPWPPVTFQMSGRTYYFPFRLYLKPVRSFTEPMVRPEFAYVAENLLLRGGYWKTHFQADQTTLQAVSQMGDLYRKPVKSFVIENYVTFIPRITWKKALGLSPEVFPFREFLLQSLVRQYLSHKENLQRFLNLGGLKELHAEDFEVLGEKALSAGYIDILIKDLLPVGYSRKIVVEVKLNRAQLKDVEQLENYLEELGEECLGGFLIARSFPKRVLQECQTLKIRCFTYSFEGFDSSKRYSFAELRKRFRLEPKEEG